MADQNYEFNVNAIDWTTRDTAWKPTDGDLWFFHSHPDYDGIVYLYGDGVNVTGSLNIYAVPWQGGVILTDGRKAMDELITTGLSGDGWYTIAEMSDVELAIGNSSFVAAIYGGVSRRESMIIDVAFNTQASARTHQNTSISIRNPSGADTDYFTYLTGARLAKADTGGGGKLQVEIDDSAGFDIFVQKYGNLGAYGALYPGWELVTATTTNNDKTPDGITTASFLVAGEELKPNTTVTFPINMEMYSITTTDIRCCVDFGQTVRPSATGITITYTGSPIFKSGNTTVYTFAGGETYSNITPSGNRLYFTLTPATPVTAGHHGGLIGASLKIALT